MIETDLTIGDPRIVIIVIDDLITEVEVIIVVAIIVDNRIARTRTEIDVATTDKWQFSIDEKVW